MSVHVEGSFELTSWEENPAEGLAGTAKVTVAAFGQKFAGGVDAETTVNAVMTYREDGTADIVGFQRVLGAIGDREGSFVLTWIGVFDGTQARAELSVVPGSGTGELTGIRGTGTSGAPHGSRGEFSFDYDLD